MAVDSFGIERSKCCEKGCKCPTFIGKDVDRDCCGECEHDAYKHNKVHSDTPPKIPAYENGRALAYIIINFIPKSSQRKDGTDLMPSLRRDKKNLTELFKEELGFDIDDIVVEKNLDKAEFNDVISNKVKEKIDKADPVYKAIFIFILSHGTEKGICVCHRDQGKENDGTQIAKDNNKEAVTFSIDEVLNKFSHRSIPTLKGIPRCFFINTCRGVQVTDSLTDDDDTDMGVPARNIIELPLSDNVPEQVSNTDSSNFLVKSVDQSTQTEHVNPGDVAVAGDDMKYLPITPTHSDMLVAYSSLPREKSFGNIEEGTWFIHDIVETIKRYKKTEDLASMMVMVNEKVGRRTAENKSFPCSAPLNPERKFKIEVCKNSDTYVDFDTYAKNGVKRRKVFYEQAKAEYLILESNYTLDISKTFKLQCKIEHIDPKAVIAEKIEKRVNWKYLERFLDTKYYKISKCKAFNGNKIGGIGNIKMRDQQYILQNSLEKIEKHKEWKFYLQTIAGGEEITDWENKAVQIYENGRIILRGALTKHEAGYPVIIGEGRQQPCFQSSLTKKLFLTNPSEKVNTSGNGHQQKSSEEHCENFKSKLLEKDSKIDQLEHQVETLKLKLELCQKNLEIENLKKDLAGLNVNESLSVQEQEGALELGND